MIQVKSRNLPSFLSNCSFHNFSIINSYIKCLYKTKIRKLYAIKPRKKINMKFFSKLITFIQVRDILL